MSLEEVLNNLVIPEPVNIILMNLGNNVDISAITDKFKPSDNNYWCYNCDSNKIRSLNSSKLVQASSYFELMKMIIDKNVHVLINFNPEITLPYLLLVNCINDNQYDTKIISMFGNQYFISNKYSIFSKDFYRQLDQLYKPIQNDLQTITNVTIFIETLTQHIFIIVKAYQQIIAINPESAQDFAATKELVSAATQSYKYIIINFPKINIRKEKDKDVFLQDSDPFKNLIKIIRYMYGVIYSKHYYFLNKNNNIFLNNDMILNDTLLKNRNLEDSVNRLEAIVKEDLRGKVDPIYNNLIISIGSSKIEDELSLFLNPSTDYFKNAAKIYTTACQALNQTSGNQFLLDNIARYFQIYMLLNEPLLNKDPGHYPFKLFIDRPSEDFNFDLDIYNLLEDSREFMRPIRKEHFDAILKIQSKDLLKIQSKDPKSILLEKKFTKQNYALAAFHKIANIVMQKALYEIIDIEKSGEPYYSGMNEDFSDSKRHIELFLYGIWSMFLLNRNPTILIQFITWLFEKCIPKKLQEIRGNILAQSEQSENLIKMKSPLPNNIDLADPEIQKFRTFYGNNTQVSVSTPNNPSTIFGKIGKTITNTINSTGEGIVKLSAMVTKRAHNELDINRTKDDKLDAFVLKYNPIGAVIRYIGNSIIFSNEENRFIALLNQNGLNNDNVPYYRQFYFELRKRYVATIDEKTAIKLGDAFMKYIVGVIQKVEEYVTKATPNRRSHVILGNILKVFKDQNSDNTVLKQSSSSSSPSSPPQQFSNDQEILNQIYQLLQKNNALIKQKGGGTSEADQIAVAVSAIANPQLDDEYEGDEYEGDEYEGDEYEGDAREEKVEQLIWNIPSFKQFFDAIHCILDCEIAKITINYPVNDDTMKKTAESIASYEDFQNNIAIPNFNMFKIFLNKDTYSDNIIKFGSTESVDSTLSDIIKYVGITSRILSEIIVWDPDNKPIWNNSQPQPHPPAPNPQPQSNIHYIYKDILEKTYQNFFNHYELYSNPNIFKKVKDAFNVKDNVINKYSEFVVPYYIFKPFVKPFGESESKKRFQSSFEMLPREQQTRINALKNSIQIKKGFDTDSSIDEKERCKNLLLNAVKSFKEDKGNQALLKNINAFDVIYDKTNNTYTSSNPVLCFLDVLNKKKVKGAEDILKILSKQMPNDLDIFDKTNYKGIEDIRQNIKSDLAIYSISLARSSDGSIQREQWCSKDVHNININQITQIDNNLKQLISNNTEIIGKEYKEIKTVNFDKTIIDVIIKGCGSDFFITHAQGYLQEKRSKIQLLFQPVLNNNNIFQQGGRKNLKGGAEEDELKSLIGNADIVQHLIYIKYNKDHVNVNNLNFMIKDTYKQFMVDFNTNLLYNNNPETTYLTYKENPIEVNKSFKNIIQIFKVNVPNISKPIILKAGNSEIRQQNLQSIVEPFFKNISKDPVSKQSLLSSLFSKSPGSPQQGKLPPTGQTHQQGQTPPGPQQTGPLPGQTPPGPQQTGPLPPGTAAPAAPVNGSKYSSIYTIRDTALPQGPPQGATLNAAQQVEAKGTSSEQKERDLTRGIPPPGQGQHQGQNFSPITLMSGSSEDKQLRKKLDKLDKLQEYGIKELEVFLEDLKKKHEKLEEEIPKSIQTASKNLTEKRNKNKDNTSEVALSNLKKYLTRGVITALSSVERISKSNFNKNKEFFLHEKRQLIQEFVKIEKRIEALKDAKGGTGSNEQLATLETLIQNRKDTTMQSVIDSYKQSTEQSVSSVISKLENSIAAAKKNDDQSLVEIQNQILAFKQSAKNSDLLSNKLTDVKIAFNKIIKDITAENTNFKNKITSFVDDIKGSGLAGDFINSLEPAQKEEIEQYVEDIQKDAYNKDQKLKSYYTLNYSIMDLIMDPQFFLMYIIKGLRILFAYVSLFLATRMFSPMYESAVYDKQQNPPSLAIYTLLYLGLDAAFNTFLFVLMYLIRVLFKPPDGDFIIDRYLFKKYIADYIISTLLLMAIANMVAVVITNKKYFRYKFEGLRAIRSFEQIMFYMACMIYVFPFFFIL
jgi:hypothetical protein